MEILKTKDLCKIYGKQTAINNVNMTIEKGDIYGFIGKNGAGKTTLMRMILTLAMPTSGKIILFGSEDLIEGCKKVGSIVETPALPKHINAKETLYRYSVLYGADESKVDEILELVGLDSTSKKKVGQFSLGMRQRLGIAIALLNDPKFMVLDEPLNGLDPVGMKEIRDLILKLNQEKGITFLISSHLLEELAKTANKIGIINNGVLIEERTMEEIAADCVQKLVFKVDDLKKAEKILLTILDRDDFKFAEYDIEADENIIRDKADEIYITCNYDKAGEINKLLVTNGVMVSGIEKAGYNLEDYYMKKVDEMVNQNAEHISTEKVGDSNGKVS